MKRKKRIGTVCKIVGCIFLLFLALFPIYWLIALAIRPTSEMTGHISILPHMLTFDHFKHLFTDRNFGTAITNSLKTTIGSLILSLAVGICAAYVLARRRFRFGLKKPVTYWILLVRVLPPVAFYHSAVHHVQQGRHPQHPASRHARLRAHQRAAHHLVPHQLLPGPARGDRGERQG